jgi:chromosome segregation ATPase
LLLLVWILARTVGGGATDVAQLETKLAALGEQHAATTRAATMRELLIALAEKQPEERGLVDRWNTAMESNSQLRAALTGYSALADKLNEDVASTSGKLAAVEKEKADLDDRHAQALAKIQALRQTLAAKETEASPNASGGSSGWLRWLYWAIGGIAVLAVGVGGFFVGRRSAFEQWGDRAA